MPREYATGGSLENVWGKGGRESTDVPSLREEYPQEEKCEERDCAHPSVGNVRRRFIQPCLVLLSPISHCPLNSPSLLLILGRAMTYTLQPRGMRGHSRKRGLLRLHGIHLEILFPSPMLEVPKVVRWMRRLRRDGWEERTWSGARWERLVMSESVNTCSRPDLS